MNNNKLQEHGIISVNHLLDTPSKEIADKMSNSVREGEADSAMAMVFLKKLKKIHDLILDSQSNKGRKDVKELLEQGVLAYKEGTKKTFTLYGAEITEANGGRWDFSKTEDEYLQSLYRISKKVKSLIKLREDKLKIQAAEFQAKNKVKDVFEGGIKHFTVSWEDLPVLSFKEGYGEADTIPPTKYGATQLRFTL